MNSLKAQFKERVSAVCWWQVLAVSAVFFATAVFFQWRGDAYQSEYGGHPDEAAHYVTGLMMRDYLAAGLPGSPLGYAKKYYDHYPKVALGNWPPMFYVFQSGWSLVFSPQRVAMLAFMALLAGLTAMLVFCALKQDFGAVAGVAGAALLVSFPLFQQHTAMIMTEVPIALLSLAAILLYGRFLEKGQGADSILFGVVASVVILTKGSGFFLGLVPPVAILFTRRWELLKRAAFWYPAFIVVLLAGPWTWLFRNQARAGWLEGDASWKFTQKAIVYYPQKLLLATGIVVLVFAAVGVVSRLVLKKPTGKWAAVGAPLFGLIAFHCLIPCGYEARHLVPALPLMALFAIAGVLQFREWATARGLKSHWALILPIGLLASVYLLQTFHVTTKGYHGFGPVAEAVLRPENEKAVFLISSDARGEGMFISEVAVREKRPGHVIQRASKALATSTWSGSGYQTRFESEAAAAEFLKQSTVDILVVDKSVPDHYRKEHHELLWRTLDQFPSLFQLQEEHPIHRDGKLSGSISTYRIVREQ